jgi:hypothetical protein
MVIARLGRSFPARFYRQLAIAGTSQAPSLEPRSNLCTSSRVAMRRLTMIRAESFLGTQGTFFSSIILDISQGE